MQKMRIEKMTEVFAAYVAMKEVTALSICFIFEGEQMSSDETPRHSELENQDIIDAMLEQLGC
jgi:hypothetical protein